MSTIGLGGGRRHGVDGEVGEVVSRSHGCRDDGDGVDVAAEVEGDGVVAQPCKGDFSSLQRLYQIGSG